MRSNALIFLAQAHVWKKKELACVRVSKTDIQYPFLSSTVHHGQWVPVHRFSLYRHVREKKSKKKELPWVRVKIDVKEKLGVRAPLPAEAARLGRPSKFECISPILLLPNTMSTPVSTHGSGPFPARSSYTRTPKVRGHRPKNQPSPVSSRQYIPTCV